MTINIAECRSEWENSCCAQSVQSEMRTNISPLCFPSIRKLLWAAIYSPSRYFLFLFCVNNVTFWRGKRCLCWKRRSRRSEKLPSWPPSLETLSPTPHAAEKADDEDLKPSQQRISRDRSRSITLPAISSPAIFPPTTTSFVLHSRFFWSETIFPIFLSSVCIKVRTLLGILAIGICYLFFSGAKEEAAVWLKKALIQPAIASLCFPVTLSTSIRRQWKWYRSKALLPPPRTKSVP